jgi:uncharacterized RDD family membrane protein YckC
MTFDDRVTIATPEGVPLELVLTGLGSRFIAAILDTSIQLALVIATAYLFTTTTSSGFTRAAFSIVAFLLWFGYDVAFEVANAGRTPGKMATGLRVLRRDGRSVDFLTSAVRNILRLVDFLPALYVVGTVLIVATRQHQRLGDIAAGTIVVRERRASVPVTPLPPQASLPDGSFLTWDVSTVSVDELATVRRFLERRYSLTPAARHQLGWDLSTRLRHKVTGPHETWPPEAFLEGLVAAKDARGV